MKLELVNKGSFWGLCNPMDTSEMIVWLTSDSSSAEVDYEKLPLWAQATIKNSIVSKRIIADPMPDMSVGKIGETQKKEVTENKVAKSKISKKKKSRRSSKKKPVGVNK